MTTIYLIRHSKATKNSFYVKFLSRLVKNKNLKLDNEGIEIANYTLNNPIFDNIDVIYSSDYNRAKETANVLAKRINKKIMFDKRLGERIHGNDKIPFNFEEKQMLDEDYKLTDGESQKEVRIRMLEILKDILKTNENKEIAIFTHSTATAFLLKKWSEVKYNGEYKYKDKVYFDGKWNYCETFKLIFDKENLISIENIKHNKEEVEIGMLCKEDLNYYTNMLNKKNIKLELNLITRDIYFTNKDINKLKELKESEIKHHCIRIRMQERGNENYQKFRIQNYKDISNLIAKNEYKINELDKIEKILLDNGYKKIIDTTKTDYQYLKGKLQLQYIKEIGMLVFLYNPKYYYYNLDKQFELLKKDLNDLGFEFIYPLGVDRLRTNLNKELCFSKNQNG